VRCITVVSAVLWQVKEVRDMSRDAAALLEDLMEYGRSGGTTAGWAARCGQRLPPPASPAQCTGEGVRE
jgi:hypothetical protein